MVPGHLKHIILSGAHVTVDSILITYVPPQKKRIYILAPNLPTCSFIAADHFRLPPTNPIVQCTFCTEKN